MSKQILRGAFVSFAACALAISFVEFASAGESHNSSRSNRTNQSAPLAADTLQTSGVQVSLSQNGGGFKASQATKDGKAAFAGVPVGTYAVVISPGRGVGGIDVMWTNKSLVSVTCEAAARRDNTFNCSVSVAAGPADLTLTLLKP